MIRFILKILAIQAEKYILISTVLNRIWCLYHVLDFKKIYLDKGFSYDGLSVEKCETAPIKSDERTNFMLRVLLEGDYERVVEIGAYDLRRPLHYKRFFPHLEVVALDRISGFEARRENGVLIDFFNIEWFEKYVGPRTVITASGTLSYFSQEEIRTFLERVYELGYDLAVAEIGSRFAKTTSLRRSAISYYHPYTYLLNEIGFTVDANHPNHAFSLSGMERREYILAVSERG